MNFPILPQPEYLPNDAALVLYIVMFIAGTIVLFMAGVSEKGEASTLIARLGFFMVVAPVISWAVLGAWIIVIIVAFVGSMVSIGLVRGLMKLF